MTTDRKMTIARFLLITIVVTSLLRITDGSRYHSPDATENSPRHRHRHRHDATSVTSSRRSHDAPSSPGRSSWPDHDEDYVDALVTDDNNDDVEDEDYEMDSRSRAAYDRNYRQSQNVPRTGRDRFEPRYPSRHHRDGNPGQHHGNPRYRSNVDDDPDRRRNSRYGAASNGVVRGHRQRPSRDWTHHDDRRRLEPASVGNYPTRNHGDYEVTGDDPNDGIGTDRDVVYDRKIGRKWRFDDVTGNREFTENDESGRWWNSRKYRPVDHRETSTNSKNHRQRPESRRNEWKSRISTVATSNEDRNDGRRKTSNHRKRTGRPSTIDEISDDDRDDERTSRGGKKFRNNFVDRGFNVADDRKRENDLDYRDYDDDDGYDVDGKKMDRRGENDDREDDDEDFVGNEDENDDADDDDDDEDEDEDDEDDEDNDDDRDFDNTNYYKSEDEPPYKTYDDIIKSLTSDDPKSPKPIVRRDYRNTGIEKYLRRDAYGNIYDSRNLTDDTTNKWRGHTTNGEIASHSNARDARKISNAIGEIAGSKTIKDREKKIVRGKFNETQTRTKSLEQEYDEDYENNDKDEDSVKASGKIVADAQPDPTNTEYGDEDNENETEGETSVPLVTSTPMTTTTSRTTTSKTKTTTTTTPRSVITDAPTRINLDRRDSKSHDGSSALQSNGLQSQQQQPGHGSHKWQSLTTRDGAKDSKPHGQQKNKNGKAAEIKEALQHAMKVSREGSCQWPRARVIPVREVYPSPSTTYIPHCAILHRCSDDTGCCRSESLTCVPKVSHRVELYFYTNSVGGANTVEKLSFYNHTECECKERMDYGTSGDKTGVTNDHKHQPTAVSPPQNIRRPPQRKPCKCPSEFTPRITDGECQCHCYENDQDCIRTKRGKGYFSLRDRLCIQNDECAKPHCEFGEYMRRQGKCPKKLDKFNAIANYPSHMHLPHRVRS